MIQEYRKQSAEWMGFRIVRVEVSVGLTTSYYYKGKKEICSVHEWNPDFKRNAYQRELIEDKLIEDGVNVNILNDDEGRTVIFYEILRGELICTQRETDKSKSIAFMKVFMEFLKQES